MALHKVVYQNLHKHLNSIYTINISAPAHELNTYFFNLSRIIKIINFSLFYTFKWLSNGKNGSHFSTLTKIESNSIIQIRECFLIKIGKAHLKQSKNLENC